MWPVTVPSFVWLELVFGSADVEGAAVDDDRLAAEVAAGPAGQEDRGAGHVVGTADAPHRDDSGHHLAALLVAAHELHPLRLEWAGGDGVDVPVVPHEELGEVPGEGGDPRLRGDVG